MLYLFKEISLFKINLKYAQVDDCLSLIQQLHRASSLQTAEHRHMVKYFQLLQILYNTYLYVLCLGCSYSIW